MFIKIPIENSKRGAIINTDNITYISTNNLRQTEIYTNGGDIITTKLALEDIEELLERGAALT